MMQQPVMQQPMVQQPMVQQPQPVHVQPVTQTVPVPVVKRKIHAVHETVVHRPVPVPVPVFENPAPLTGEPHIRYEDPRRAKKEFAYHNPIDGCHFGYHEQGRFSYYTDAQEAHHQGKPRTLLESVALGIESVHDAVFGDPAKWDDPNEYWREHAEKQGHWLHSPDPLRQVGDGRLLHETREEKEAHDELRRMHYPGGRGAEHIHRPAPHGQVPYGQPQPLGARPHRHGPLGCTSTRTAGMSTTRRGCTTSSTTTPK